MPDSYARAINSVTSFADGGLGASLVFGVVRERFDDILLGFVKLHNDNELVSGDAMNVTDKSWE